MLLRGCRLSIFPREQMLLMERGVVLMTGLYLGSRLRDSGAHWLEICRELVVYGMPEWEMKVLTVEGKNSMESMTNCLLP